MGMDDPEMDRIIRKLGHRAYKRSSREQDPTEVIKSFWNLMTALPELPSEARTPNAFQWDLLNTAVGDDTTAKAERICVYIHKNMIGRGKLIRGPFGPHEMIYCDFVASGRPLRYNVMPDYANTHSEASALAQQTNTYREESRQIIKQCINANENDRLIFTGSGSTAAINKIIQVLAKSQTIDIRRCVVIVSPFEHHSNMLPWSTVGAQVKRLKQNENGEVDLNRLSNLCRHQVMSGFMPICSLSAASNVTGILTDTETAARIVHSYGGLAFFDYATAAPYVKIDMNAPDGAHKDAVFISAHKFVGGPGSPGILVAKKALFTNKTPTTPAGGTVDFVSRSMVI
ncbi:hypothetical protein ACOME3_005270 [Neoechinorhynchus agilis]